MAFALALSGGGFRATLFHLGTIEYLRESGRLKDVRHVVGISGGSIVAAHLVMHWDLYTGNDHQFTEAKHQLAAFARQDIRGRILRRMPYVQLTGILPARWRTTSTEYLRRLYDRELFKTRLLSQLPRTPRLSVMATNLSDAGLTIFSQEHLEHLYLDPGRAVARASVGLTTVARAVAASSALPMFFPPLALTQEHIGDPGAPVRQLLSDGGVTDNLGLTTLTHLLDDPEIDMIASDAGRSFVSAETRQFGLFRTALRASDLMLFRIRELELLRARQRKGVAIVSISDVVRVDKDDEAEAPLAPVTVQEQLQYLRTDLDSFSDAESTELIRHGFSCAWQRLDGGPPPRRWPTRWPERVTTPVQELASELRRGSKRKLWRSLLSPRDPITAVNALAIVLIVVLTGWLVPKVARPLVKTYHGLTFPIPSPVPIEARSRTIEQTVDKVTESTNEGFEIESEERVWDLRSLKADDSTGVREARGNALMTRVTTLKRTTAAATSFAFWGNTSATTFKVWPAATGFPATFSIQREPILNGLTPVYPWELRLDVSHQPIGQPFALRIQARPEDGFRTQMQWWTAMRIDREMGSASMRIVFPEALPFKYPSFVRHRPYHPDAVQVSFEGSLFTAAREHELLWTVPNPLVGWTYRVEWFW